MTDKQIPHADDDGKICPLRKKAMAKVCHTCPWWQNVRGKDPQSEEIVDHWGCAIAWLPFLLTENSQMQRQIGAAVESTRNEAVKGAAAIAQAVGNLTQTVQAQPVLQIEGGRVVGALPPR